MKHAFCVAAKAYILTETSPRRLSRSLETLTGPFVMSLECARGFLLRCSGKHVGSFRVRRWYVLLIQAIEWERKVLV
jgi:hypothetical protein